jgi:hypothetical protein
MNRMGQTPDAELKEGNDIAALYRNAVIKYGKNQTQCDRMAIEYGTGNTDDLVFYDSDGERKVGRIRQGFDVLQGSASATATFSSFVEEVSPADKLRLRTLYNKLLDISNSKTK